MSAPLIRSGLALAVFGVLPLVCPDPASAQASAATLVEYTKRSAAPEAPAVEEASGPSDAWTTPEAPISPVMARQLDYPRVREAYRRKTGRIDDLFAARGIERLAEIYFRVFKHDRTLEVWARPVGGAEFTLLREYPVCAVSGRLGPKRREGDLQIPEGFYEIELLNPWSKFHLSMRVSYPNAVDRQRGHRPALGGDIYIHGGCKTIGCVPVTDEYIEELYLIAIRGREAGQRRIPVHIFPTRLDVTGLSWLARHYGRKHVDYAFWQNLAEGYRAFEETRRPPLVGHEGDRYAIIRRALSPGVLVSGSGIPHIISPR